MRLVGTYELFILFYCLFNALFSLVYRKKFKKFDIDFINTRVCIMEKKKNDIFIKFFLDIRDVFFLEFYTKFI